ncbi:MAG: cysteine desulfurase [Eubacteriaceae bacterium]|nr:cysteine desulfurase [Eubacteriaceae bacterium]
METIYLDNAASTKPYSDIMQQAFESSVKNFANPSSLHYAGQKAASELEAARESIAGLIGSEASEALFSPGGSASVNAAILGTALRYQPGEAHFITSAIEHSSVLECFGALEGRGYEVDYLMPDERGVVSAAAFEAAVRENTKLVSVMAANNETGAIQPIYEIAKIGRQAGIIVHTDFIAAFGHMPISLEDIDMLSICPHKLYGPKGIGLLYAKKGTRLYSLIHGGSQEQGVFAGTQPVFLAKAFALSSERATKQALELNTQVRAVREFFENSVLEGSERCFLNSADADRLPGISSISFEGIPADRLLAALDADGLTASAGAACKAGGLEPSHVIEAMRPGYGSSTIRFSFGRCNTMGEAGKAAGIVIKAVKRARQQFSL